MTSPMLIAPRQGFTESMRTVFFSWLGVVAVGLVYMIAVALSGR